jgi:hypothetical protein
MEYELTIEEKVTLKTIVKTPDLRVRLVLVASTSACAMLSENNIVSFYLGDMLTNARITSSTAKLEIVRFTQDRVNLLTNLQTII